MSALDDNNISSATVTHLYDRSPTIGFTINCTSALDDNNQPTLLFSYATVTYLYDSSPTTGFTIICTSALDDNNQPTLLFSLIK